MFVSSNPKMEKAAVLIALGNGSEPRTRPGPVSAEARSKMWKRTPAFSRRVEDRTCGP